MIDEAAAILYAHWGIGEWCERDDEAGFQGEWPPPLGNGLKVLLEAGKFLFLLIIIIEPVLNFKRIMFKF